MNTEKLIVVKISNDLYSNNNLAFEGTLEDAKNFAVDHGIWGGIEENINGEVVSLHIFSEAEVAKRMLK